MQNGREKNIILTLLNQNVKKLNQLKSDIAVLLTLVVGQHMQHVCCIQYINPVYILINNCAAYAAYCDQF